MKLWLDADVKGLFSPVRGLARGLRINLAASFGFKLHLRHTCQAERSKLGSRGMGIMLRK